MGRNIITGQEWLHIYLLSYKQGGFNMETVLSGDNNGEQLPSGKEIVFQHLQELSTRNFDV